MEHICYIAGPQPENVQWFVLVQSFRSLTISKYLTLLWWWCLGFEFFTFSFSLFLSLPLSLSLSLRSRSQAVGVVDFSLIELKKLTLSSRLHTTIAILMIFRIKALWHNLYFISSQRHDVQIAIKMSKCSCNLLLTINTPTTQTVPTYCQHIVSEYLSMI